MGSDVVYLTKRITSTYSYIALSPAREIRAELLGSPGSIEEMGWLARASSNISLANLRYDSESEGGGSQLTVKLVYWLPVGQLGWSCFDQF